MILHISAERNSKGTLHKFRDKNCVQALLCYDRYDANRTRREPLPTLWGLCRPRTISYISCSSPVLLFPQPHPPFFNQHTCKQCSVINKFTKYIWPLPVTLVVLVTLTLPSGLETVLFLISISFISMLRCVGKFLFSPLLIR